MQIRMRTIELDADRLGHYELFCSWEDGPEFRFWVEYGNCQQRLLATVEELSEGRGYICRRAVQPSPAVWPSMYLLSPDAVQDWVYALFGAFVARSKHTWETSKLARRVMLDSPFVDPTDYPVYMRREVVRGMSRQIEESVAGLPPEEREAFYASLRASVE